MPGNNNFCTPTQKLLVEAAYIIMFQYVFFKDFGLEHFFIILYISEKVNS